MSTPNPTPHFGDIKLSTAVTGQPVDSNRGRLFVIAGPLAAGKTAVGHALSQTLTRSVFIDGPMFDMFVINGAAEFSDPPSAEAIEQFLVRYVAALTLADVYRAAGFDVVISETILGDFMEDFIELAQPEDLYFVMLNPRPEALSQRYSANQRDVENPPMDVWEDLHRVVDQHTTRHGLWLDNSDLQIAETALAILTRQDEAYVDTGRLAPQA